MAFNDQARRESIEFNRINLSHGHQTTFRMGQLVPVLVEETLPNDRFRVTTNHLLRMMPLVNPVMGHFEVIFEAFWVRNRTIWDGWEKYITGGEHIDEIVPTELPSASYSIIPKGSQAAYMGLPINSATIEEPYTVQLLPFAASNKIWNDFYRNENLQIEQLPDSLADGRNAQANEELVELSLQGPRRRNWKMDKFTGALPFVQKGQPVNLPVYGTAPITFQPKEQSAENADRLWSLQEEDWVDTAGSVVTSTSGYIAAEGASSGGFSLDNSHSLNVNLANATAGTIEDLRQAVALQRFLELNAVAGTRYVEFLKAHFNANPGDIALDRAKFLGGSKSTIAVSEVLQQSETANTPLGEMAGHGININSDVLFNERFQDYGYIIVYASVRPKATYFQGVPKHFLRQGKFDFFFKDFANLGEQAIKNLEVFVHTNGAVQNATFGYEERYAEYRSRNSRISGEFTDTLSTWVLTRRFNNQPSLNASFITCDPPPYIFAVDDPDLDNLLIDIYFEVQADRPIPRYAIPKLIG